MRRVMIGIFGAIVAVILFIVLFTFVRRPYETVVLDRFGSLIEESHQTRIMYNWYLKLPTDGVVRVDTRLHLYNNGPLQEVSTAKKEPISIRTFAAWHIVDPVKFYRTTGGSDLRAREIMDQKLRGLVQGKLAAHQLDDFFNTDETKIHTREVEQEVAKEATEGSVDPATNERQSGLKDQGLEIVEVGFSRMAFPPANAEAVYSSMVASLNGEAFKYDAEGRAEVDRRKAEGDREAARIRNEATAEAQAIRGKADANAANILAIAQSEPGAQEFYQYWKSLEFWKSAMSKNTYLVLSTDTPVLRSLFDYQAPTTMPRNIGPLSPPQPVGTPPQGR